MKQILQYLFNHHTLTKAEAKAILIEISQNKFNESEVISFITVFLMRTITLQELEGFREALLQLAKPVDLGTHDLVDIVGTGGDGKNTFNISTLASFIVAGTGQKVAKVEKDADRDYWMSAEEAKDYGLIDEIIKKA